MNDLVPVITVDGPSGSGKGTLAVLIARHLGWHLLDSGALYRAVAAVALDRGVDIRSGADLLPMIEGLSIDLHRLIAVCPDHRLRSFNRMSK